MSEVSQYVLVIKINSLVCCLNNDRNCKHYNFNPFNDKSVVLFNNFQHSSYMDKMGLYIVNFICYNNYPFSFGAIIAVNVW